MIHLLNDSSTARCTGLTVLAGANIAVALASGAFGIVAIINPSALVGSPVTMDLATAFYSDMYGLRAAVIAAGLVTACLTMRRAPLVAAVALAGGGLVQLGDVAIAARFGTAGAVGASVAVGVHLASAGLLLHLVRRSRARPRRPHQ
jgi:hypothetical protein